MGIDDILIQIRKTEDQNTKSMQLLLNESKQFFNKLNFFTTSELDRTDLQTGIVGRRLSDKIFNLEDTMKYLSSKTQFDFDDMVRFKKSLLVILDHLNKFHIVDNFDINISTYLDDISNSFQSINELELQLKKEYFENCLSILQHNIDSIGYDTQKLEYKRTYEVYKLLFDYMKYEGVIQLKKLNDEYQAILSIRTIAKEYKNIEHNLWLAKEKYHTIISERDILMEAAKHLTQYQKAASKSKTYLDEVTKNTQRMATMREEERTEISELIDSYKEAYNIMQNEMGKLSASLKTYNVQDAEDYDKKLLVNKDFIAKYDSEVFLLERKLNLLEIVLTEIQQCRKKALLEANSANA